jgi:hypothetical protein
MTKKEFLKEINKSKNALKNNYKSDGICCCVASNFDKHNWCEFKEMMNLFEGLYKPEMSKLDRERAFWLGKRSKENLPKRLMYLDHFKNFLLETEMYKEL